MHLIQQSASSGLYHDIPNLYKFIYHDQTEGLPALKNLGLNLRLLNQVLHFRVVTFEEKTCTRATLEFDSREVPGYPRFTLCSLKWGHDLPSEFQGDIMSSWRGSKCSGFSSSEALFHGLT